MTRIPASEYRKSAKKKRSKYGAKRITVEGINFDSKKEAARYHELRLLEIAGEIGDLQRQVRIPLNGADGPIMTDSGKRHRVYIADFSYVDWRLNGVKVYEDSKGFATPEFKLKLAILNAQNVEIKVT